MGFGVAPQLSSAHFLLWSFPIIWSRHLTFFFDKIRLIFGGVGTGDLKMCKFLSPTGFGLEFLVDSGICTFLCELLVFDGIQTQIFGQFGNLHCFVQILVFDGIRAQIFGRFGNLHLFVRILVFDGIRTRIFSRFGNLHLFFFNGIRTQTFG